ncbi:MAG: hypothetical protein OEV42_10710 [Deltaproteobacteria bacterium]|nr:hypothetical protein [Deltaproteobacteria bacterium]
MKISKKVALAIMITSIFLLTSTAGHSAEKKVKKAKSCQLSQSF